MVMVLLLLLLMIISSVARSSIDISLTSGKPCVGAVATWTCVVDGGTGIGSLGWRNLGRSELPAEVNGPLVAFGSPSPFSAKATCVAGSVITSIAVANLTNASAVNGSTLECSNGGFGSLNTTISNITLYFQDSSPVQLILMKLIGSSLSEFVIHICWPNAVCAPSYQLNITRDDQPLYDNITEDICYEYNVSDIGTYTISVSSIDYFGMMVGKPATTKVHIRPPDIIRVSSSFNYTSSTISIIIQDSVEDQLSITSCNISLMSDDESYNDDQDCTQMRVFEYSGTGITCGRSYTYIVNISNVVNSTIKSGPINLVCIEPSVTTIMETISFCSMTSSPSETAMRLCSVTPSPINTISY
ncbi:PREDICTED: uncharacterized protein LOC100633429 [Amphimedon queenslandica]|uniref:Ig-like domain-containing protein n=2 Tax=Amphimedon queenslandica TaxID=400682 RepID=A0AAN0IEF6_AMPQE|nr:PREDICTED: uncharacterized protein LOC100633429 [Amphimedon queenslandica]|eukprot:XP_003386636.1 PREDICTED: uncharacterized protein LOC100633429 [Amphimedon queenslandica]